VAAVIDSAGDRYEADMVVRAIGVEPNIDFLAGADVPTRAGVLVDEHLKSGAPDVWAAGDCAEIQFPGQERTVIHKLWYTAQPQGWVAGENMAGGEATYQLTFQYQSAMFMDLDFCSYGEMPTSHNDLREENLTAANGLDAIRLVHDGTLVVGASFLGRALTKEDIEHMATSGMALDEARAAVDRVFSDRYGDRAPRSRIAEPRRLSRRPYFWPFSLQSVRRGWTALTGGF
jgi:NAD(P)H-nitrite reductase large subunit